MSEFDIEDEEDDLFEDAADDVEAETEDVDVEMEDADGDENDIEGEEDENENDNEENDVTAENCDVQVGDYVDENEVVSEHALFKKRYPMAPGPEYVNCSSYDIVPYVAAIHACEVHCVAVSWGLKYMFTGGQDGFIRKYNFMDSINGKLPLTVAQRHPFVDSITRAGVLVSYWENEQPVREKDLKIGPDGQYEPKLSPVYSITVQSEAIWLLAGLQSGGITLQSVRFNEGQIHAYLDGHTSTVSTIKLDDDETHALSGSWDKTIIEWDLDTGKAISKFNGASGQISSLEWQPVGGSVISQSLLNNAEKEDEQERRKSLGSLFGDDDEDDGNEYNNNSSPDNITDSAPDPGKVEQSHSIFLTSSIDGSIDIWDRRQQSKAAAIKVPNGVPPWCTSACWGADGNFIYCGRRNSTIDEFDIRASLTKQSNIFKFPSVSGAVSSVRAMPTGRHLLCGSHDNIRLYDLTGKSKIPFFIVPGHHGAVLSDIYVDPSCQYLITSSGSRGWQGNSSDVALIYEIQPIP